MAVAAYLKGVGAASAGAGPLFLLATAVTAPSGGPLLPSDVWPLAFAAALASIPVGFALAVVPNLFGAAVLSALGRSNDGVRLPAFWALAGAGAGSAIDGALFASGGTTAFLPLFTLVGLFSALLCRWGTRWID